MSNHRQDGGHTVRRIPDKRCSVGVRGDSDTVRIAARHERRPHPSESLPPVGRPAPWAFNKLWLIDPRATRIRLIDPQLCVRQSRRDDEGGVDYQCVRADLLD